MSSSSCAICGVKCTTKCVNCKKAWYCSREHQKKDWKAHQSSCFPALIASSPEFGRFLQATRNIKEGELVLKERALFSGPNGKNGALLLCLECYGVCNTENSLSCSNCKWHLHKGCINSRAQIHVRNECKIFQKQGITPSTKEEDIYDKILVLRGCLLKQNDAKSYSLALELQDHCDERKGDKAHVLMTEEICEFILNKCGLSNFLTRSEVDHILGVVVTNAYVTEDNLTASPSFQCGSFIFSKGSMPAHSCLPNCKWTVVKEGHELRLWALRDIKEGDSLTHCYAWGGSGTLERQKHLLKSKFFLCLCTRCGDPSEMGSYFSGLKCKASGCDGFIVTENPKNIESDWNCNKCKDCRMSEKAVSSFVEEMRDKHSYITGDVPTPSSDLNWRETLQKLEQHRTSLLSKFSPNHFLLQEVEQDILLRISHVLAQTDRNCEIERKDNDGNTSTQLDVPERLEMAAKLVLMSKECLKLLDVIAPGITTHSGRQHYYLQQGMGVKILHDIQLQPSTPNPSATSVQELRARILEWQNIRAKGSMILKTESPGREEFLLGQAMTEELSSR